MYYSVRTLHQWHCSSSICHNLRQPSREAPRISTPLYGLMGCVLQEATDGQILLLFCSPKVLLLTNVYKLFVILDFCIHTWITLSVSQFVSCTLKWNNLSNVKHLNWCALQCNNMQCYCQAAVAYCTTLNHQDLIFLSLHLSPASTKTPICMITSAGWEAVILSAV